MKLFTVEEIDLIRARYPTEGAVPLARDLGRPRESIITKARTLGVRCVHPRATASHTKRQQQGHVWTEAEDALLRQEWPKVQRRQQSAIRVAERLGVTLFQVRQRAGDLGLRAQRIKEPLWTDAEDELIANNAHMTLKNLTQKLRRAGYPRTEAAVSLRRYRLSIAVTGNGDYYSASELARLLGVTPMPILRWIRQGWLPAKTRGETSNAQGGPGDRYLIAHKDVKDFIVHHTAHVATALASADKHWLVDLLAGKSA